MCGTIVHVKCPALPVLASVAIASKSSKLSRKTAVAKKKPPPQDLPPPTHPSGVVVDVVGTSRGNCGCSCMDHPDGCGTAVLVDDIVVCIQKEQILIKDYLLGKEKRGVWSILNIHQRFRADQRGADGPPWGRP
jgi:hypothetical protein